MQFANENSDGMDDITKVAILISKLTIGGAEQLLLELLRKIDRNRFDIQLLFLRDPGQIGREILELGYTATTDVIRKRFDTAGVGMISSELQRNGSHILLLINHLNTLFYGVAAAVRAGIPVVNWENETNRRYPMHKLTMLARSMLHLRVQRVVAAANGHADYIRKAERISQKKITVIYNGVDPARFKSTLSRGEARRQLGIPPESNVVSILAALRPDKAHEIFLKAAQIICSELPATHFLVIGDGPQRAVLENMSADLGISGNVHFLGFQRNLGDIFAAVDVNAITSMPAQETLSVACLEALSAGVPVVSTRVGSMDEIVIQGETGYLVNQGEYRDIAGRILCILRDDTLRQRMSTQARDMVEKRFTVDHMARSFEKLFREVRRPPAR